MIKHIFLTSFCSDTGHRQIKTRPPGIYYSLCQKSGKKACFSVFSLSSGEEDLKQEFSTVYACDIINRSFKIESYSDIGVFAPKVSL